MRNGGSKSRLWQGHGELSLNYWRSILRGARLRELEVTITINDAWALFERQGGRCALSGVGLVMHVPAKRVTRGAPSATASLDRIDSTCGYNPGNVQWVHKHVNIMKRDHSDLDFIEWCRKVVAHADKAVQ